MKKKTFYQVNMNDAGGNFQSLTFDTKNAAKANYDTLLAQLASTEKYHEEDNTNEWLYLELVEIVADLEHEPSDVDYIVNYETLETSEYYYRSALL